VSASLHYVDFAREDVDVAVRHGDGRWAGLQVTRLCTEALFPVCSPKLLRGRHALRSPDDLRRHVLLHLDDRRDWVKWLEAAGVEGADLGRGPVFNQASMAIDAAVDGQGVALARTALAAWDLLAGRLARLPFGPALAVPYGYWIVYPRATADLPKITAFRNWLVAEAEEDAQRLRARALVN
jgi:LysR family transcriptional regulator, glycine cleavage system transcriptional activator